MNHFSSITDHDLIAELLKRGILKGTHILQVTDGSSLDDYMFYNSSEDAKSAMKKAYQEMIPGEWDKTDKDMSYCGDNHAVLYQNGENVYIWQIIPLCSESSVQKEDFDRKFDCEGLATALLSLIRADDSEIKFSNIDDSSFSAEIVNTKYVFHPDGFHGPLIKEKTGQACIFAYEDTTIAKWMAEAFEKEYYTNVYPEKLGFFYNSICAGLSHVLKNAWN